ncbi:hypothetical protein GGX14DRAFT_578134 [Mycena pura]|uniref:F-box domain-containing protein n=1 Tax=Mycena pura TaxID=153505 RepID=A0AAD6UQJ9_9AGAR|nr:hypothetical protein GGX14DRAFT_578134 [Mycena pura]
MWACVARFEGAAGLARAGEGERGMDDIKGGGKDKEQRGWFANHAILGGASELDFLSGALLLPSTMTVDLPLEILQVIAANSEDRNTLLSLRLVSKTFDSIASQLVFQVLIVRDSVESAEAVASLLACESIASLVREVAFEGTPRVRPRYGWIDDSATSGGAGRIALARAFSGLVKLPKLSHLRLEFWSHWQEAYTNEVPEEPTHFLQLQFRLFEALAAVPPSLVLLTLRNVLGVPNEMYQQETFLTVFHGLQILEISVIYDYGEGYYVQDPIKAFWAEDMSNILANARSLTTLVLRSDHPVGHEPALSFRDTHLPKLQSLTIQRFCLVPMIPDADVLAFILRHASTLAFLELRDCSVDGGMEPDFIYPRPWHAVFTVLKDEMHCLCEFVLENTCKREPTDGQDRRFAYTRLENSYAVYTDAEVGDHPAVGNDQDLPALERLLAVLEERRNADKEYRK